MTDPVRKEMYLIQGSFLLDFSAWHDIGQKNMGMKTRDEWWRVGQERQIRFTDDLLRVIRGHTFHARCGISLPQLRVCDTELTHTFESLPEEK